MSIKNDALYGRTWDCDFERPIVKVENDNATPPHALEIAVESDIATAKLWKTPAIARKRSHEVLSHTEELCDVNATYPHMEPDAETSLQQPNNSLPNPRSSKYNVPHNPKPYCNDDYSY